mgnify:CR=1 FL=1
MQHRTSGLCFGKAPSGCRPASQWLIALAGLVAIAPWALLVAAGPAPAAEPAKPLGTAEGYRGIWYSNQKTNDEYAFKYSGGMATYPQQHMPIAIHAPAAGKTFFVYGGTVPGNKTLLHMVSYFDHATGTAPRPRILLDKKTTDAHDNPTLTIDAAGYLWIYSNAHGTSRPSFIHRSEKPYSIDAFRRVKKTNFSYSQPWTLADGRQILLHTKYNHAGRRGRGLFWMTSADGTSWSDPQPLAHVEQGHYQVSRSDGRRVATAFNHHPTRGGLNARTNLYYLATLDGGTTWNAADGTRVETPITAAAGPALVRDYASEGLLVYLKQVQFDTAGNPVIMYLTSRGYAPGPDNDPRTWRLARWDGSAWLHSEITQSDHNYDYGTLYVDDDAKWQLVAPTDAGPQPYGTGGQMVVWSSPDQGRTWKRDKTLTHDTELNHTYARQPLAFHPDFALLWADGHARERSDSSLYYTDRAATHVWRLPVEMTSDHQQPDLVW